jgi:hypothetical protein
MMSAAVAGTSSKTAPSDPLLHQPYALAENRKLRPALDTGEAEAVTSARLLLDGRGGVRPIAGAPVRVGGRGSQPHLKRAPATVEKPQRCHSDLSPSQALRWGIARRFWADAGRAGCLEWSGEPGGHRSSWLRVALTLAFASGAICVGACRDVHPKRMMLGRRGFGTVIAHASVRDHLPSDM